jgi:hypothetical protein
MANNPDFVYDVRIIERYLREGKITKNEYEQYLKNLPDMEDEGCPLIIDDGPVGELEVKSNENEDEPS